MTVIQFTPLSSLVQPAFWHDLVRLKIDVLKLSAESQPVTASYSAGKSIVDRETGQDVALGCQIALGGDAFDKQASIPAHTVAVCGVLKNFNTIEEFKSADKLALFNGLADELWTAPLLPNRHGRSIRRDGCQLKNGWEAKTYVCRTLEDRNSSRIIVQQLLSIYDSFSDFSQGKPSHPPYFIARQSAKYGYEVSSLSEWNSFFKDTPEDKRILGFVDPSANPQSPGWPLRNLLTLVNVRLGVKGPLNVLAWRDTEVTGPNHSWHSRLGVVSIPGVEQLDPQVRPTAVGWEKNTQGKLAPRLADLAPMMDPARINRHTIIYSLADQAVDLNLKLMRWRILPGLNLEKVAKTKCLLLGAGTLGCYVARTLMVRPAWLKPVCAKVRIVLPALSFSNPVRQPLFEFADCLEGGKPKAACAAESLKKIFPVEILIPRGVRGAGSVPDATGIDMSIPMPGHPIPPALLEKTKTDVARLEELIDKHDAVFLLMDSRESRWLPTVIGASKGKIVMNAALGFDSFLVMRHGVRASRADGDSARLGCYYCNDIVAPADSLSDRTLDQMCTVTRPGLAAIASSTGVEILVSLLQLNAPAPKPGDESSESILGVVPHQLRGFLAQFSNKLITGAAYDKCTGCSETVLKEYESRGFEMALRAFNETGYLEKLTGLDKLHADSEAAMESVDWVEGGDGEGDDDF
ncbi:autophagy protein 7 [Rhizoctonia solani AG-1 IA]|uniref:Autophagy protein 7 n=1 Tax=Thanatephorus cucumeris (strain AG1-IA) TaxID=983506 RepID=L8WWL0_THACA|nr:autophagy protein 7 [Rhizoctonia solani AG-1 IA]